ncbi:hypothetical protein RBSH_03778 [Rhodopirellula baltica SH28]|uniref:Uncharacterized protein n=1 Tax=Rhodopirellula baltica SH28 TaxID=993517 RepID=K5D2U6_RHOBT|nr:hypothetical protein RBSH_03778 [Rhodopirellula baltica SH28]
MWAKNIASVIGELMRKRLANNFSSRLRVSEGIAQFVDKRRAASWFFGLTLTYALLVSFLIGWRDANQPNPGMIELALRLLLIGVGFLVIHFVLYRVVVRPAVSAYESSSVLDQVNENVLEE